MKQEVITKINKFGKIGEVIAQIGRIIVIMGAVILLAISIFIMAMPKDWFEMQIFTGMNMKVNTDAIGETITEEDITQMTYAFDGNEMKVTDVWLDQNNDLNFALASLPTDVFQTHKMVIFIMAEMLLMVVNFITLTLIVKLCKEFKTCETPFAESVIKRMKQVGFSLIPWCVVYPTAEAAADFMLSANFQLSVDVGMIIVILVVLALTYIFQYGAMLQQESDETL